jgi:hypothetical protein
MEWLRRPLSQAGACAQQRRFRWSGYIPSHHCAQGRKLNSTVLAAVIAAGYQDGVVSMRSRLKMVELGSIRSRR